MLSGVCLYVNNNLWFGCWESVRCRTEVEVNISIILKNIEEYHFIIYNCLSSGGSQVRWIVVGEFSLLFVTRMGMVASSAYMTTGFPWCFGARSWVYSWNQRRSSVWSELSGVCLRGSPIPNCRVQFQAKSVYVLQSMCDDRAERSGYGIYPLCIPVRVHAGFL